MHLFLAALAAAAAGLRPGATAGRSVTVPRRDPYSSDSSDSLARADVSFFGLTATAGAEQGTALEAAGFADNSTAAVGLLPAGEVVSNGGGGVAYREGGNGAAAGTFELVTSRLEQPGLVTYRALSVRLSDGGIAASVPLPEVRFVLWDGFGVRAAAAQLPAQRKRKRTQAQGREAAGGGLVVLAPTSNISNPGEPTQRYDLGIFLVDFENALVRQLLALQGNPISAGGASAFDAARDQFWFVLGDLSLVQRLCAVDISTAATVAKTTLTRPPGLTLLAWDAQTRDMFGVGVTPQTPPTRWSRFEVARLDAESGEVVSSFSLDEQAKAAGWRTARVSNIACVRAGMRSPEPARHRPMDWICLPSARLTARS